MRIAYCMINCNRRDGSARPVNEVSERLADQGHQIDVFARGVEHLDLSKVTWRRMPGLGWPDFAAFTSYHLLASALIKASDFDIVHSVGNNARAANVITIQNIQPAKRSYMDRVMGREETSFARKVAKWLFLEITTYAERQMYTRRPPVRPPLFLPVSKGVEVELREHYDIGDAPVRIIPNAADTTTFRPVSDEERLSWRFENGFSAHDIVLIFVGGEWGRKGLDLAILSLKHIPDGWVKLFIAGSDPDQRRYQKIAEDAGVGSRVVFGGFREDTALALASADAFLFPSWYEAFSLATIEAAACGLPIFASRITGAEDFVIPGENGDFVEHDAEAIAAKIRMWLAKPTQLKWMGENARRKVEREFTWDRVANSTLEAYQEYLEGGSQ